MDWLSAIRELTMEEYVYNTVLVLIGLGVMAIVLRGYVKKKLKE